jgi:starvation-inducible DNA-binding protein
MAAGLDKKARQSIKVILSKALANTYILLAKTQNFHWNVVDPRFHSLHELFQQQYEALFEAADEIAERIRMLGFKSPGSLREFLDLGTLDEAETNLSGDDMLSELLIDHELIIKDLREQIKEVIDLGDEGTGDMLIDRLRFHEKTAWMLHGHFFE